MGYRVGGGATDQRTRDSLVRKEAACVSALVSQGKLQSASIAKDVKSCGA